MDISVIICTHNPREDYLERTLNALRGQRLPYDQWELLLIDNASKEQLDEKWDLSWHPAGRHLREKKLGLTNARLMGIKESKGALLLFVDDDNVLFSDYLEEVIAIAKTWPTLGAWGGQQFPEFEEEPPLEKWKVDFWSGKLDRDIWSNNFDREAAPSGSGACIRKRVAMHYASLAQTDDLRLNLGRNGTGLNAAEDIDMDYSACDLGLGTGRFRALKLTHLIPAKRLTDEYLYKLCEGFGYSETILEALRGSPPQQPCRIDKLVAAYKRIRMKDRATLDEKARAVGRKRAFAVLAKNSDSSSSK